MAKLNLESITVSKNRTLHLRYEKVSAEGFDLGWHRTTVEAKEDVAAQMQAVNDHLAQEGFEPSSEADLALAQDMAELAWSDKHLTAAAREGIEKRKAEKAQ